MPEMTTIPRAQTIKKLSQFLPGDFGYIPASFVTVLPNGEAFVMAEQFTTPLRSSNDVQVALTKTGFWELWIGNATFTMSDMKPSVRLYQMDAIMV